MVELTVPYESRMEEAHAFKEGKYLDLTKELQKNGYEARCIHLAAVVRRRICKQFNMMYAGSDPGQATQEEKKVGSREASGSHELDVAGPP
ncbi:reverse transcriptase [Plakobranchus ocellatus]|uniref:Reverse transcriptase n=1 Tax=Plakobranchus ocellatus TaxID=259542 RepID=A0AAV4CVJ8_9GAST|nr:reverse transcriptase [Plakobranchus ocellatus]